MCKLLWDQKIYEHALKLGGMSQIKLQCNVSQREF